MVPQGSFLPSGVGVPVVHPAVPSRDPTVISPPAERPKRSCRREPITYNLGEVDTEDCDISSEESDTDGYRPEQREETESESEMEEESQPRVQKEKTKYTQKTRNCPESDMSDTETEEALERRRERKVLQRQRMQDAIDAPSVDEDTFIPDEEDIEFELEHCLIASNVRSSKVTKQRYDIPLDILEKLRAGAQLTPAEQIYESQTGVLYKVGMQIWMTEFQKDVRRVMPIKLTT